MNIEEMQIGKWYLISRYGFESNIKGKLVEIFPYRKVGLFKFYWGGPIRTKNYVPFSRLLGECENPGWFSNK